MCEYMYTCICTPPCSARIGVLASTCKSRLSSIHFTSLHFIHFTSLHLTSLHSLHFNVVLLIECCQLFVLSSLRVGATNVSGEFLHKLPYNFAPLQILRRKQR